MKKLIPADTVDAKGNVWETTGENIRNGAKEFSEDSVKEIVDILFPVGSVYCGENSFVLSVGSWELITQQGLYILSGGKTEKTGDRTTGTFKGADTGSSYYIRMWRRTA